MTGQDRRLTLKDDLSANVLKSITQRGIATVRILLVEDDDLLGEAVRDGLRQESYVVDWVQDGGAALAALSTVTFSALVLDLGLPRSDGLSVLRWLRQNGQTTPVVIVTARDRVSDRITGLDAGADDYLIKPFDIDELTARLRAITRRVVGCAESTLTVADVVLDLRHRIVTYRGEPAGLTAREYAVLELLMRKAGCLVTRTEIEEELYGFEDDILSNAIEVHIHNLRRKLGAQFITNVKGRGYRVDSVR
ncbi:MAG TPA: response regulator [Steroidobacteraceae bacterium]|jgi:two-component system response regulator QseB|nr:response regulator [Steroidobacteraceae bacterium]